MTVRTRFAPSPTGRLHLGNVRTAAFNWLFARRHGGAFVLRIEDTDVGRTVEGSAEALMEDLRWLGMAWDEGPDVGGPHGPYRQSERGARYLRTAEALVSAGLAYPCYCAEEELAGEELAGAVEETDGSSVLRYSGRCRRLDPSERRRFEREGRPHTIRFAVPTAAETIEILDEVRGPITVPGKDISDFIIVRSDGRPTYNFAVVVDDTDMEITHVLRGAGHLSNTPHQALLFDALERPRPVFAHLPTVLGPDGGKLAKREGAASVDRLREEGFHPHAVVNYVSLLGWSSPDEREILGREELVERISLDRLGASATTWDSEKLRWMSQQHLATLSLDELVQAVRPFVDRAGFPFPKDASLELLVEALRSRLEVLGDIERHLATYCFPEQGRMEAARSGLRGEPAAVRVLEGVERALRGLDRWDAASVEGALRDAGRDLSVRGSGLFRPVRKAVTALESGPDLALVVAGLGRHEAFSRIEGATGAGQV